MRIFITLCTTFLSSQDLRHEKNFRPSIVNKIEPSSTLKLLVMLMLIWTSCEGVHNISIIILDTLFSFPIERLTQRDFYINRMGSSFLFVAHTKRRTSNKPQTFFFSGREKFSNLQMSVINEVKWRDIFPHLN